MAAAVGKQVAFKDSFKPRWSPVPACFLIPWGSSERKMEGIDRWGCPRVCQTILPLNKAAFSSRVSFSSNSLCFKVLSSVSYSLLLLWKPVPSFSSLLYERLIFQCSILYKTDYSITLLTTFPCNSRCTKFFLLAQLQFRFTVKSQRWPPDLSAKKIPW